MKHGFVAYFLVFCAAVAPVGALAVEGSSTGDGRYFLPTANRLLKGALGVRHTFEDGFTTDLSEFQLRLVRLAGTEPIPVVKYDILEESPASASRAEPKFRIPWGVAALSGFTTPAGGASVSVAVLDTGIALHPDLEGRIVACADFTESTTGMTEGSCDDRNGHGTHVAGIIAADGGADGKGVYGIAPQTDLLIYKVCNDAGSCLADDIAAAIRTAADAGVQIINLSFGGDTESSLIADAVAYAISKDALVVAAAGNDGPYPDSVDYPAALEGVMAVAAMDADAVIPEWSSRGDKVDAVAPGVNVESAFKEGGYAILSGTSLAAPHVTGLAAKHWEGQAEKKADATKAFVRDFVRSALPVVAVSQPEPAVPAATPTPVPVEGPTASQLPELR